ncbi:MAG TPA: ABC transporter ATP-binding protein [Bryobacteraceae bacterium]|nr:ABC transporter ATP-binding protein [Bryobacteraceae bacterium]
MAQQPAEPDIVVEFKDVSKTFNEGTHTASLAIRDINFEIHNRPDRGEFVSLLGPSGCGKSTILRLIAGLRPQFPPTTGQVLVSGKSVQGPGADRGMVFQDYTSFDNRTVLENVSFGMECAGMPYKERSHLAQEWITKVGLNFDRDASKYPHQLSGGMRQRVAIARSLALRPKIILMDEPFGALDPVTRLNMQDLLIRLWHDLQATVFFITHSVEEAVFLGDRVFIMSPAPGTILKKIDVPSPDRPAREMQRERAFTEMVFSIRDIIENLEAVAQAEKSSS